MLSAGFWPVLGGAEGQALAQAAALVKRGHRVTVLTRRLRGLRARDARDGVEILRLPVIGRGALESLVFMVQCWTWLLIHWTRWDAVHAHLAGSPALAGALAGRMLGRPAIVKLGGGRGIGELAVSSRTLFGRAKLRLLSMLHPRFLAVVEDLAEEAREHLGDVPLEILPNGVDEEKFRPADPARKAELRRKLGWDENAIIFLYTGRFSPEKRLPWFLREWKAAALGQARAVLVGDGPERSAISAEAEPDRVAVMSARDDLSEIYAAADVFFLPSESEGLSNSLLEAMSSGMAVLASRVGGTPQVVASEQSGLLFDKDDAAELRRDVVLLINDKNLSGQLGARGRELVEQKYSLSRVVSRLEELYAK